MIRAQEAGMKWWRSHVKENRYAIRARVSASIASDEVQVVLITGVGPVSDRRRLAPEALLPSSIVKWEGRAKCFACSFEEIGTATLQCRARSWRGE